MNEIDHYSLQKVVEFELWQHRATIKETARRLTNLDGMFLFPAPSKPPSGWWNEQYRKHYQELWCIVNDADYYPYKWESREVPSRNLAHKRGTD